MPDDTLHEADEINTPDYSQQETQQIFNGRAEPHSVKQEEQDSDNIDIESSIMETYSQNNSNVVVWRENDPENPQNWSKARRWRVRKFPPSASNEAMMFHF